MSESYNFVKIVTTVKGNYRNRGIRHNVRNMEEASIFVEEISGYDMSAIHAVRIVPEAVKFSKPSKAAQAVTSGRTVW